MCNFFRLIVIVNLSLCFLAIHQSHVTKIAGKLYDECFDSSICIIVLQTCQDLNTRYFVWLIRLAFRCMGVRADMQNLEALHTMHTRPFAFVFAVSCVTLRKMPFCVSSSPVKISYKFPWQRRTFYVYVFSKFSFFNLFLFTFKNKKVFLRFSFCFFKSSDEKLFFCIYY